MAKHSQVYKDCVTQRSPPNAHFGSYVTKYDIARCGMLEAIGCLSKKGRLFQSRTEKCKRSIRAIKRFANATN